MLELIAMPLAIGFAVLIGIGVLIMMLTMAVQIFFFVPYIPTSRSVIRCMLDLADIKPGDTVYELGAGDGRVMIAAKKRQPAATVTGYEIAPMVRVLGRMRICLSGADVSYRKKNFLHEDLGDADVVLAYLSVRYMKLIEQHCMAQFRKGTRIVSHAFPLRNHKPDAVRNVGKARVYLYIHRAKS